MAEIITKDRKEYNIWDKINGVWNRLNFLTSASSVDASDGKDLQTKVGAINGISSSSTATDENIAASIGYVNQELTELNTNLGGIEFSLDADGKGQYRASGASDWTPFLTGVDVSTTQISVYNGTASSISTSLNLSKGKYLVFARGLWNSTGGFNGVPCSYSDLTLTDVEIEDDFAPDNNFDRVMIVNVNSNNGKITYFRPNDSRFYGYLLLLAVKIA